MKGPELSDAQIMYDFGGEEETQPAIADPMIGQDNAIKLLLDQIDT